MKLTIIAKIRETHTQGSSSPRAASVSVSSVVVVHRLYLLSSHVSTLCRRRRRRRRRRPSSVPIEFPRK